RFGPAVRRPLIPCIYPRTVALAVGDELPEFICGAHVARIIVPAKIAGDSGTLLLMLECKRVAEFMPDVAGKLPRQAAVISFEIEGLVSRLEQIRVDAVAAYRRPETARQETHPYVGLVIDVGRAPGSIAPTGVAAKIEFDIPVLGPLGRDPLDQRVQARRAAIERNGNDVAQLPLFGIEDDQTAAHAQRVTPGAEVIENFAFSRGEPRDVPVRIAFHDRRL